VEGEEQHTALVAQVISKVTLAISIEDEFAYVRVPGLPYRHLVAHSSSDSPPSS
jgi:hypothetical protein